MCAPTAPADVVSVYMEDLKPTDKGIVKNLVQRGCPNFDLLCELFENNLATGRFAAASTQADQNDANESDPDNENYEESDPNPSIFSTGCHSFSITSSAPSSPLPSSPLQSNSVILNSRSSSSSTQLKKRAATHGLMNGERPKRSHTRKDDSFSTIDRNLQNAMALLEKEATPAQVPPAALVDRFAAIPEAHQLSLRVAEHLGALLTRLNGRFKGEDCEWLAPHVQVLPSLQHDSKRCKFYDLM
ncbi:UNVERIFIED_CONTAM: hypothetical protein HDU68_010640 [Siphonaria sp. JEL0065]|nr:hypothetical protein HDU68_010640 [Siphonaria sp. JEL0065]